MVQNNLSIMVGMILNAPLWVQEAVMWDIRNNILKQLNSGAVYHEDEIYSIYVPKITLKGRTELETHDQGYEPNIYKYLDGANQGLRVIDITLNNFWSLEESSQLLACCINNQFIKMPENPIVAASVFYLGNEIRLGEYVKRLNLISVNDLDDSLRNQKVHNEQNPDNYKRIGEIMVDSGLVQYQDIEKIIHIKDEAKKRFILSSDMKAPAKVESVNYAELQQKIQKLTQENNFLKDKLRAVFNIQAKKSKV